MQCHNGIALDRMLDTPMARAEINNAKDNAGLDKHISSPTTSPASSTTIADADEIAVTAKDATIEKPLSSGLVG